MSNPERPNWDSSDIDSIWDSLADDARQEREEELEKMRERRLERLEEREEAKTHMKEVARKIATGALAAITLAGMIWALNGPLSKEFMDGPHDDIVKYNIEKVEFYDGPNVRKDPRIGGGEDQNVLTDMGDYGQFIVLEDFDTEVLYHNNEYDPNGGWYGFKATELADKFEEESYLTKGQLRDIRSDEKHGDGYVWVNENYVSITKAKEPNDRPADPGTTSNIN